MNKVAASFWLVFLCSPWPIAFGGSGAVEPETRLEKWDCSSGLPTFVLDEVRKNYKEWEFVEHADLVRDDQLLFGEKCPGVAKGHFDKLEAVSYALLLRPRSRERVVKLVVMSVAQESVAKTYVLWRREIVENFPVLRVLSEESGKLGPRPDLELRL